MTNVSKGMDMTNEEFEPIRTRIMKEAYDLADLYVAQHASASIQLVENDPRKIAAAALFSVNPQPANTSGQQKGEHMKFINWLKKLYNPSTCEELMARELDAARRDLLLAETAKDYAESMVLYNDQRIERLTEALKERL